MAIEYRFTIKPQYTVYEIIGRALSNKVYSGDIKNLVYKQYPYQIAQNADDKIVIDILDKFERLAASEGIYSYSQLVVQGIKLPYVMESYLIDISDFVRACGLGFFRIIKSSYDSVKRPPFYVDFSYDWTTWNLAPKTDTDLYSNVMDKFTKSPIIVPPTVKPPSDIPTPTDYYERYIEDYSVNWQAQAEAYSFIDYAKDELLSSAITAASLNDIRFSITVSKPEYRYSAASMMSFWLYRCGWKSSSFTYDPLSHDGNITITAK
ncbi:hypothetical protein RCIP0102_00011 [Klebsiella phage RCIP0102]|uniref:Uncharacterized protein n=1 Tax=Klebsiella phage RCIP0102 TaxID=3094270 RepID=A0AAX4H1B3_9VIRU